MQNKTYEIIPYKSIGSIYFSDKRESIREKIGGEYLHGTNEFEDMVELYDFFPGQDIKVLYDKNECLGSIEFFSGGAFFLGNEIMNIPYSEMYNIIMHLDSDLESNEEGLTSYKLGIGIARNEEDDVITSVIVFKKDYYS